MDAYAFALTLGTAGLAAMTVLGFHQGERSQPGWHVAPAARGDWPAWVKASDPRDGTDRRRRRLRSGARTLERGCGRLNSAAYASSVISREPGGAA
jgi:hypothetical protein